jgi:RimJ/RimL family protein N-acetyltransferase
MEIVTNRKVEHGLWLAEKTGCEPLHGWCEYIGLEKNGAIIAVCGYDDFNVSSVRAHIAIEGRINRRFLWLILHYPFEQLKVKKIVAPVHSANAKSVRFCEKMGFVKEAIVKDLFADGDLFFLTLTKNQSKMLSIGLP